MARNFVSVLLVLLVSVLARLCAGQEPLHVHYGKEDGLPSNTIYDIYRDSKGYMWFATDKGVARFNGIRFTVYTTFNGLADNEVFSFQEDKEGRLWFATLNGQLCFFRNDSFFNAKNTSYLRVPFKTSFIHRITVEPDGSILILFADQIKFAQIANNRLKAFSSDHRHGTVTVSYMEKITDNRYRLHFSDKIVEVDSNSRVVSEQFIAQEDASWALVCQNVPYVYNRQKIFMGGKHIGTIKALYVDKYKKGAAKPNRFFFDGKRLFVASHDGLMVDDSISYFDGEAISSISRDINGDYWVGSLQNGLYKLPRTFAGTVHHKVVPLPVRYAKNIDGRIFYTLANGDLYEWVNDRAMIRYDHSAIRDATDATPIEPGILLTNDFRYFLFFNNKFVVVDDIFKKNKPKKYRCEASNDGIKDVSYLGHTVYQTLRYSIQAIADSEQAEGQPIRSKTVSEANLGRVFCVVADSSNTLYYSTNTGLFKVRDSGSVKVTEFGTAAFKNFKFFAGGLAAITDYNMLLYSRRASDGHRETDTFAFENCIWSKLYDLDQHDLLVSTNGYYYIMTNSGGSVRVRAVELEYLPRDPEAIVCDKTKCYFFKQGNITAVAIEDLLRPVSPPRLSYSYISTTRRKVSMTGNGDTHDFTAAFDEAKKLSVAFSALSIESKNVSYQYSFSGFGNEAWIDRKGEEINLSNPGYGTFILKVRAKTLGSGYSSPIVLRIMVEKPFWARWWFITFLVASVTFVVWQIIRYRIRAIVRAREEANDNKIKFLKSEFKALNALMNPHFIFNTLNNVQSLVNRDDKRAANEYLRIFADLIRQNMHNVSNELIPLEKEINLVKNYLLLEKLRFKDHLHYEVNIDDSVDVTDVQVPPLLIQPLVENAIKHGILPLESAEGRVIVNVKAENDVMLIEVRDNGVGLNNTADPHNSSHISYGMNNIRKRIEQLSIILNAQITFSIDTIVDDNSRRWTIAAIKMPM